MTQEMPTAASHTSKDNQKRMGGCVDYRKYKYCKLMWVDDGLAERGMTWQLRLFLTHMVLTLVFAILGFLTSSLTKSKLDNVRCFLLESMVTMSLFNEYVSRKELARLHKFMDKSMITSRTGFPEEEIIIEEARKWSKRFIKIYIVIFFSNGWVMAFSQPISEALKGGSWKQLPFPWIEPSSDVDFWVVFVFQCFSLYISHCQGMVIMSFSAITIQMSALFDVLLLSINRIEDRCRAKMEALQIDRRRAMYECMKEDLIHHTVLVRELTSATPHLRRTFFELSVTISMIMACEAYPLIMGNFTLGELVKGLLFLVIQLNCWSQMCTRMEVMSDQNTAVFYALYGTPWHEMDVQYRKLMYTTLMFSREPMYIKSPLFTDMSATMATFYSFVVSSFNILNLIRKMN